MRPGSTFKFARRLIINRICFAATLSVAVLLTCVVPGCSSPTGDTDSRAGRVGTSATVPPPPPAAPARGANQAQGKAAAPALPPPPPAAAKQMKPKIPITRRTTQEVRDASKERAKGAKEVKPRIAASEPITLYGSAYITIVSRATQLQIKHAIDLFRAANGRYPKDFDEFYREIIKANNIRLPALPPYQKYGYDPEKHELVILEYPDKKAQILGQQ